MCASIDIYAEHTDADSCLAMRAAIAGTQCVPIKTTPSRVFFMPRVVFMLAGLQRAVGVLCFFRMPGGKLVISRSCLTALTTHRLELVNH